MKPLCYFIGPKQLQQKLKFKYKNEIILREVSNPYQLQSQQDIKSQIRPIFIVARPQFIQKTKQIIKGKQWIQLFIDEDQKEEYQLEQKTFIIADSSLTIRQALPSGSIDVDKYNDIPGQFLNGKYFLKLYFPKSMEQQAHELGKKNFIKTFLYKQPDPPVVYIVGDYLKVQNAIRLKGPQQLIDHPDLMKKRKMTVFIQKKDKEVVIENMKKYRGNKIIIIAQQNDQQKFDNVTKRIILEQNPKQLIFVTDIDDDPHKPQIKQYFDEYPYQQINRYDKIYDRPELLDKTDLVVIAYQKNTPHLNNKVIGHNKRYYQIPQQGDPIFKDRKKKKLIFVSDRFNDPYQNKIKQHFRVYPYQRVNHPKQLQQKPQIMDDTELVIVNYEKDTPRVQQITKLHKKALILHKKDIRGIHKRLYQIPQQKKLLVFISKHYDDKHQKPIKQFFNDYPYQRMTNLDKINQKPQIYDQTNLVVVAYQKDGPYLEGKVKGPKNYLHFVQKQKNNNANKRLYLIPQQQIKNRKQLVFISNKFPDVNQQQIKQKFNSYPYVRLDKTNKLFDKPQIQDQTDLVMVLYQNEAKVVQTKMKIPNHQFYPHKQDNKQNHQKGTKRLFYLPDNKNKKQLLFITDKIKDSYQKPIKQHFYSYPYQKIDTVQTLKKRTELIDQTDLAVVVYQKDQYQIQDIPIKAKKRYYIIPDNQDPQKLFKRKKQLIFITNKFTDQYENPIRDHFNEYPYQKMSYPELLNNRPQLTDQTDLVVVAYQKQTNKLPQNNWNRLKQLYLIPQNEDPKKLFKTPKKKKLCVFVSNKQKDPFQKPIKQHFYDYPYKRVPKYSDIMYKPQLKDRTDLVIVNYQQDTPLIQNKIQGKNKRQFEILQDDTPQTLFKQKKKLFFVSHRQNDKFEPFIKQTFPQHRYQRIFRPQNIPIRKQLTNQTDLIMVNYQKDKALGKLMKGDFKKQYIIRQNDSLESFRRRIFNQKEIDKLVFFISGKYNDPYQQPIKQHFAQYYYQRKVNPVQLQKSLNNIQDNVIEVIIIGYQQQQNTINQKADKVIPKKINNLRYYIFNDQNPTDFINRTKIIVPKIASFIKTRKVLQPQVIPYRLALIFISSLPQDKYEQAIKQQFKQRQYVRKKFPTQLNQCQQYFKGNINTLVIGYQLQKDKIHLPNQKVPLKLIPYGQKPIDFAQRTKQQIQKNSVLPPKIYNLLFVTNKINDRYLNPLKKAFEQKMNFKKFNNVQDIKDIPQINDNRHTTIVVTYKKYKEEIIKVIKDKHLVLIDQDQPQVYIDKIKNKQYDSKSIIPKRVFYIKNQYCRDYQQLIKKKEYQRSYNNVDKINILHLFNENINNSDSVVIVHRRDYNQVPTIYNQKENIQLYIIQDLFKIKQCVNYVKHQNCTDYSNQIKHMFKQRVYQCVKQQKQISNWYNRNNKSQWDIIYIIHKRDYQIIKPKIDKLQNKKYDLYIIQQLMKVKQKSIFYVKNPSCNDYQKDVIILQNKRIYHSINNIENVEDSYQMIQEDDSVIVIHRRDVNQYKIKHPNLLQKPYYIIQDKLGIKEQQKSVFYIKHLKCKDYQQDVKRVYQDRKYYEIKYSNKLNYFVDKIKQDDSIVIYHKIQDQPQIYQKLNKVNCDFVIIEQKLQIKQKEKTIFYIKNENCHDYEKQVKELYKDRNYFAIKNNNKLNNYIQNINQTDSIVIIHRRDQRQINQKLKDQECPVYIIEDKLNIKQVQQQVIKPVQQQIKQQVQQYIQQPLQPIQQPVQQQVPIVIPVIPAVKQVQKPKQRSVFYIKHERQKDYQQQIKQIEYDRLYYPIVYKNKIKNFIQKINKDDSIVYYHKRDSDSLNLQFQKGNPQLIVIQQRFKQPVIQQKPQIPLVKLQNRNPFSRQRVFLVGKNMQKLQNRLKQMYEPHILTKICKRDQQIDKKKLQQIPTIIIYGRQFKDKGTIMSDYIKNMFNVYVFSMTQSPNKDHLIFDKNQKISVLSHVDQTFQDQIQNYLGAKQVPIIDQRKRKKYGKTLFYYPQKYSNFYHSLLQNHQQQLIPKPYSKLDQIKLKSSKDSAIIVYKLQQNHDKIRSLPYQHNHHFFMLFEYPSQIKDQLDQPYLSAISPSHVKVAQQIQNYLGNQNEEPLLRHPKSKYLKINLHLHNPQNNQLLTQLFQNIKQQYPDLMATQISNPSQAINPCYIISGDKNLPPLIQLVKKKPDVYLGIKSFAPSVHKEQFSKNWPILAVTHKPHHIKEKVEQLIKEDKPFGLQPHRKAYQMNVYLINQTAQQKHIWLNQSKKFNKRMSIFTMSSCDQLYRVNLYSHPSIIVINEQEQKQAQLPIKQNLDNDLLFLFIKSKLPTQILKRPKRSNFIRASSNQLHYLPQFSKLFMDKQKSPSLFRQRNIRQFKHLNIYWKDDKSYESTQAMDKLYQKYQDQVDIQKMHQIEDLEGNFKSPGVILIPVQYIKQAIKFSNNNKILIHYIFVYTKSAYDQKSLFDKYKPISVASNNYNQIKNQIQKYLEPTKQVQLVKQPQRKGFKQATLIFHKIMKSPFVKQAIQIQKKIPLTFSKIKSEDIQDTKFNVNGPTIVIGHDGNLPQLIKLCQERVQDPYFRMMIFSKNPSTLKKIYDDHKRLIVVGWQPTLFQKEIQHYYKTKRNSTQLSKNKPSSITTKFILQYDEINVPQQRNPSFKIRTKSMSKVRINPKYKYLKKMQGKLVWNMIDHQKQLMARLDWEENLFKRAKYLHFKNI